MEQNSHPLFPPELALSKLMALCSKQEKCSFDILKKLRQWGFDENDARKILQQLKEEKFVEDERFVRFYIKDKFRLNKWGRQKIMYQLRQKGIPEEMVRELWESEINPEEQEELILSALKQKNRTIKPGNTWDRKARLLRFAQSRGYDYEIVNRIIDQLLET